MKGFTASGPLLGALAASVVASPARYDLAKALKARSMCLAGSDGDASGICQQLSAAYPDDLYMPGSSDYTTESTAIWDLAAVKQPGCVLAPKCADDMAAAVKMLADADADFTVRSGGHMPVVGHNSIGPGGVMLTTTHFTEMSIVQTPNPFGERYARLGANFRWQQVYEFLGNSSLTCAGGRVSSVGSSLTLGGGLSYLSGFLGWVANQVVNYEMVLANGTVAQINNGTAPDLWRAMKGGSSNFGIVTRYDIRTVDADQIFGGTVVWNSNQTQDYLDAQAAFIAPGGGSGDPKAAIMPNFGYTPSTKQNNSGTVLWYFDKNPNPKALENFTSIPYASGSVEVQNISAITATTSGYSPRTDRWYFYNTAVRSDPRTMNLIYKHVHDVAEQMIPGLDIETGAAVQPVTHLHLQSAIDIGGDAIDLDPAEGDFVIALVYARYSDAADDDRLRNYMEALIASIEEETKAIGLYYPWKFLNDAGLGQDPIATYGYGKQLDILKQVSAKYDPAGVFQKSVPGFKLRGEVPSC